MARVREVFVGLKKDAEQQLPLLIKEHGGRWQIEKRTAKTSHHRYKPVKHPSGWWCYQTETRGELELAAAVSTLNGSAFDLFAAPSALGQAARFGTLYRQRDQLKAKLDKWAAEFAENPTAAFKWATDTIQASADYTVVCQVITQYEDGRGAKAVAEYWAGEAERLTRYDRLDGSTSPMSNLADTALRIAANKIALQLQSYVKQVEQAKGVVAAHGDGLV